MYVSSLGWFSALLGSSCLKDSRC